MGPIPTGCGPVDEMLRGGLPLGAISLAYGEATSGRTTFALQCAISCAKKQGQVLFILTDHLANVERLSRMLGSGPIAKDVILFLPRSFHEQQRIIDGLEQYITRKVRLIVFDTVTELYHAELGSLSETIDLNRELNRQLARLAEVAKKYHLSVLLTAQVHAVPEDNRVEPVASRILKYWSDIVLRLERGRSPTTRRVVLEKFLGRRSRRSCYFKMTEAGIRPTR
ncbi:TPA: hypothetical protein EYP44_05440 [Candidatus Bathyarchaeota archaeon]|nr:hypothetical protein [Candidatus Bathyarchaeota archaeon]